MREKLGWPDRPMLACNTKNCRSWSTPTPLAMCLFPWFVVRGVHQNLELRVSIPRFNAGLEVLPMCTAFCTHVVCIHFIQFFFFFGLYNVASHPLQLLLLPPPVCPEPKLIYRMESSLELSAKQSNEHTKFSTIVTHLSVNLKPAVLTVLLFSKLICFLA